MRSAVNTAVYVGLVKKLSFSAIKIESVPACSALSLESVLVN
jgi:hypothetical protein